MFFWIQGRLDLRQAGQFDAIENLGEAGFAGRHLVLGDRVAIDAIAEQEGLSRKALAYYRSVRSKYSQVAVLRRLIPKINVSAECYSPFKDEEWVVPLESFKTDDAVERALVIVEHMYDYKVVVGLARISLRDCGASALAGISLTPISGGGGATSLTLSVHQNNNRSLGLCVVDSDRPHIKGAVGSTARGCLKIYEDRWSWRLHVIAGRELENIIPPEIYEMAGIDFKLSRRGGYNEAAWAVHGFADTKKGDCLCRFRLIDAGNQSYKETAAALAQFMAPKDTPCPSHECELCEPDENLLIALSAKMDVHPLAGLQKMPSQVAALSDLLKEVVSYGAVAKWSMI